MLVHSPAWWSWQRAQQLYHESQRVVRLALSRAVQDHHRQQRFCSHCDQARFVGLPLLLGPFVLHTLSCLVAWHYDWAAFVCGGLSTPVNGQVNSCSLFLWVGPAYLSELLHVYTPSRTLRSSSDTRMLEIQQYKRKTHGFCTFSCFGPHIWNSLPQDIRHCSSLSSFKAKLKTFLFSQYFHPN